MAKIKTSSKFQIWTGEVVKNFNSPVSNATQRLSTWSSILTGIVSLIIAIVALKLSIEQSKDRQQLDMLTEMVKRLDSQTKATNRLSVFTAEQNSKLDSQSRTLVAQNAELIKQVEYSSKIFSLSKMEAETMNKSEAAKLNDALTDIFYQITYTCETFENTLVKDNLDLRDTVDVDKIDEFSRRIQRFLAENNLNSIVVKDNRNKTIWDDYLRELDGFNTTGTRLMMQGKIYYPFIEKSKADRQKFFDDYKRKSLVFYSHFENKTKSFPLGVHLKNRLKP